MDAAALACVGVALDASNSTPWQQQRQALMDFIEAQDRLQTERRVTAAQEPPEPLEHDRSAAGSHSPLPDTHAHAGWQSDEDLSDPESCFSDSDVSSEASAIDEDYIAVDESGESSDEASLASEVHDLVLTDEDSDVDASGLTPAEKYIDSIWVDSKSDDEFTPGDFEMLDSDAESNATSDQTSSVASIFSDIASSQLDTDSDEAEDAAEQELRSEPYTTEPVPHEQLMQDLATPVTYHRRTQSLGDHINLGVFGPEGLARVVGEPGSYAVCSPEQSDKTVSIAGVDLVSARMHKPSVNMVCDIKNNTKKVRDSLQDLLRPFGIEVRYMSGKQCWDDASESVSFMNAFRDGMVVLVISTHANEIRNLNDFLARHSVWDLTLVIDESDNVWSSWIESASQVTEVRVRSQREAEMYRLLGSLQPGSWRQPLQVGSRVRSLIQVSATHVNTILWHQMWQLPFKAILANKDLLDARGYASERDMYHARRLDPTCLNTRHEYGISSEEVTAEFNTFRKDNRPGRLMMLCLTPYVRKDTAMTSFAMAERVLQELCPEAVCVVVHGRGVNLMLNDTRHHGWSKGQGISFAEVVQSRQSDRRAQQKQLFKLTKQAGDAIEYVDGNYGLNRPVVVIGYSCIGRCTSIRSETRVINHIIAGYQKGRTCADLKQMLMRGAGGGTRAVRQAQGYLHIRVVCTDDDWEVVQNLYDFTQAAFGHAATGRVEDLPAWTTADYSLRFRNLVQTRRPMVRPTMGVVDLSRVRFGGQPLHAAAPCQAVRRPEGTALESRDTASEPYRKKRRVTDDRTAVWYKLMRCIWSVCCTDQSASIFRQDIMDYCDAHDHYLSRAAIDVQHRSAFTEIGSARHLIRIDKKHGVVNLTDKGQQFCEQQFGGVLQDGE